MGAGQLAQRLPAMAHPGQPPVIRADLCQTTWLSSCPPDIVDCARRDAAHGWISSAPLLACNSLRSPVGPRGSCLHRRHRAAGPAAYCASLSGPILRPVYGETVLINLFSFAGPPLEHVKNPPVGKNPSQHSANRSWPPSSASAAQNKSQLRSVNCPRFSCEQALFMARRKAIIRLVNTARLICRVASTT